MFRAMRIVLSPKRVGLKRIIRSQYPTFGFRAADVSSEGLDNQPGELVLQSGFSALQAIWLEPLRD